MKKQIRKCLHAFRPPLGISCLLALVFSTASLVTLATDWTTSFSEIFIFGIYGCAAVFLLFAVWAVILFCREASPRSRLLALARRNEIAARIVDSFSFRTVAFTYASLASNIVFALAKGVAGWLSSSFWLISLSAYYLVLCFAKFLILRDSRKLDKQENPCLRQRQEWKAYRVCGMLLLVMTIILLGIVVLILFDGNEFIYHGTLIFAVALYDFFCLTNAVVFMLRTRRQHTPVIVAIKTIGFATALVSVLSLQTAMFAAFGKDSDTAFKNRMNAIIGAVICFILLFTGIAMIAHANKSMKHLQQKNTEVML